MQIPHLWEYFRNFRSGTENAPPVARPRIGLRSPRRNEQPQAERNHADGDDLPVCPVLQLSDELHLSSPAASPVGMSRMFIVSGVRIESIFYSSLARRGWQKKLLKAENRKKVSRLRTKNSILQRNNRLWTNGCKCSGNTTCGIPAKLPQVGYFVPVEEHNFEAESLDIKSPTR